MIHTLDRLPRLKQIDNRVRLGSGFGYLNSIFQRVSLVDQHSQRENNPIKIIEMIPKFDMLSVYCDCFQISYEQNCCCISCNITKSFNLGNSMNVCDILKPLF